MKQHRTRLRDKMMLVYLAGGLLPMVLILLLLLQRQSNAILTLSCATTETELGYLKNSLNEECRILSDVSKRMYFDPELETIARTEYSDYTQLVQTFRDYDTIDQYEDYYSGDIESITVYLDNPTLMGNSQLAQADETVKAADWYRQALADSGRARWWVLPSPTDGKSYLTLVRLLRSQAGEDIGVAALRMNLETLQTQFSQHNAALYLMLGDTIVLTNDANAASVAAELAEYCAAMDGSGTRRGDLGGESVRIAVQTLEDNTYRNALTLICAEPYRQLLDSTFRGLWLTVLLIVVSVGCSVLMIFSFSQSVSGRVGRFRGEMERAAHGARDLLPALDGNDEISELYQYMTGMVSDIDTLTASVYESRLEQEQMRSRQHEVEFKMLASQINPHFLYNTLESIRMKAFASGDREVADMIKLLAKLMRRSIEVCDKPIPLSAAFEQISAYLRLQNYRFSDAITTDLTMTEEVRELPVLPLLIQPLVENAFVHGIRNQLEGSRIGVSAFQQGDDLIVTVKDNGVGMDARRLEELREELADAARLDSTHIGLANVQARIRLYYGAAYGLTLDSAPGQGTAVTLKLPANDGKEQRIYE